MSCLSSQCLTRKKTIFSAIYVRYSSRRSAATCPTVAAAVLQSSTKVAPNDYFRSRVQTNIGLVPKNVQPSNCFRFDFMDFCRESCFVNITILDTTHHKITRSNNTCRISGCLGKLHDKLYLGPLYVKRTMKLLVKVMTIT